MEWKLCIKQNSSLHQFHYLILSTKTNGSIIDIDWYETFYIVRSFSVTLSSSNRTPSLNLQITFCLYFLLMMNMLLVSFTLIVETQEPLIFIWKYDLDLRMWTGQFLDPSQTVAMVTGGAGPSWSAMGVLIDGQGNIRDPKLFNWDY